MPSTGLESVSCDFAAHSKLTTLLLVPKLGLMLQPQLQCAPQTVCSSAAGWLRSPLSPPHRCALPVATHGAIALLFAKLPSCQ